MLSLAPRKSVQITKHNPTINVGDNSYFSVRDGGTNPKVILSRGKENGHLLLIKCSLNYGFKMVDNISKHRTEISGDKTMKGGDTMLLVWSGSRWVQVSYSKNS